MSDLALRPRRATELVDATIQVYRREPVAFILTAASAYLPFLILAVVAGIFAAASTPGAAVALLAVAVAVAAFYVIGDGAMISLTRDVYLDRPVDLGGAFRNAFRRAGSLLAANLAMVLLIGFSAILLILPAFYMFARTFSMRQAIMLESVGVNAAFTRASALSDGTKRHILSTMGLTSLLAFVVNLGAGILVNFISNELVQALISLVVTALLFPLVAIAQTLLYYDLRIRKEGFDIEVLASGDLGGSPAAAPTA